MSAAKKSFKNNPALSFISSADDNMTYEVHDTHNAQETHDVLNTHDAQEVQEHNTPASNATQGRKGQKLPRINMAFSPENLEHIRLMARVTGCSATAYVNQLIAADREQRGEVVAQAAKLFGEAKK